MGPAAGKDGYSTTKDEGHLPCVFQPQARSMFFTATSELTMSFKEFSTCRNVRAESCLHAYVFAGRHKGGAFISLHASLSLDSFKISFRQPV